MNKEKGSTEQFTVGEFYIVDEKGALKKCAHDPDDDRRKYRISSATHELVVQHQKLLRKSCGGHKPDVNLVAEALLLLGLNSSNAVSGTIEHCRNIFSNASAEVGSS